MNELAQQVRIMRMEAEITQDRRVRSQLEGVIMTIEDVMDAVKLAGLQEVSYVSVGFGNIPAALGRV